MIDLGASPRDCGDIQTAVVRLVDALVPRVRVDLQPAVAREIAEVIASRPSSMGQRMFLRQSIIRNHTATLDQVVDGLAAWVTVLFDIGNLCYDRARARDLPARLSDEAMNRLEQTVAASRNGCILAVPHSGSLELFVAHVKDCGFNVGFVYSIGKHPTPTEKWLLEGRCATHAKAIALGRRQTGRDIAEVLGNRGVLFMLVDVYPSYVFKGISVKVHEAEFNYASGPARYARGGTQVMAGAASCRDAGGFAMDILEVLPYDHALPARQAAVDFTQRLAAQVSAFTARNPGAFWLWHPIPIDCYQLAAERHRPDLLLSPPAGLEEDEDVARAVEAFAKGGRRSSNVAAASHPPS